MQQLPPDPIRIPPLRVGLLKLWHPNAVEADTGGATMTDFGALLEGVDPCSADVTRGKCAAPLIPGIMEPATLPPATAELTQNATDNLAVMPAMCLPQPEMVGPAIPPPLPSTAGFDGGLARNDRFVDVTPVFGAETSESAATLANAQPRAAQPSPVPLAEETATPMLAQIPIPMSVAVQTLAQTDVPPSAPAPASAGAAVPLEAVPMAIAAQVQDGVRRFEIRLDPADLGRVDIRLDIDAEGSVRAHLIVERPGTLQQLQQDAPRLEQALTSTGATVDQGGLSFSLKQEQSGSPTREDRQTHHGNGPEPSEAPAFAPMQRRLSVSAHLDLFV